jgi:cytochrome b561
MMSSKPETYGPVAKGLHWLVVALLLVQYAIGLIMPDIRPGMTPEAWMNLHMSIGFVVLVVIVVRLAWRLTHPVAPESTLPGWQRTSSEGLHWLLYLLVLASTLTGWTYASMRGWTLSLFGTVTMPALVAERSPVGRVIGEGHSILVWVLAGVIGLHVLAALGHLVVHKDRVMHRMLPGT